jgi:hypothetical protein
VPKKVNLYEDDENNPHYYTVEITGVRLYHHPMKDKLLMEVGGHEVGEIINLAIAAGLITVEEETEVPVMGPVGEA